MCPEAIRHPEQDPCDKLRELLAVHPSVQVAIPFPLMVGVLYITWVNHGSPSPCAAYKHATCYMIEQNVNYNGLQVDIYALHCPYGPPCSSM